MPEKQKTRNWKDPKTIIAAVSITMLVTIWNTFATQDRGRTGDQDTFASTPSATPESTPECPTPAHTLKAGEKCVTVTSTRSS